MEQIALTIKRALTYNREQRYDKGCIRMSELNQTEVSINNINNTTSSTNITEKSLLYLTNNNDLNSFNESNTMKSALDILYMTTNSDIYQTAHSRIEEANETSSILENSHLNKSNLPIQIRRENNKDIIIINSRPNNDPSNLNVIKLKITIPSANKKKYNKQEEEIVSMIKNNNLASSRQKINPTPIMGKNALLAKVNKGESTKTDSEIVEELVKERFGRLMNGYYQRSLQRQTSRLSRSLDNSESNGSNENIYDNQKIRSDILDDQKSSQHQTYYRISADNSKINASNEHIHDNKSEIDNVDLERYMSRSSNLEIHESNEYFLANAEIDNQKSVNNLETIDYIFDNCELAHHSTFNEKTVESYKHQQACSSKSSSKDSGSCQIYTSPNIDIDSDVETISVLNSLDSFLSGSICDLNTEPNLNFLLSTDENNIETSEEQIADSSNFDHSQENSDRLSYDAVKFLEAALGDEWKNYASTDNISSVENRSIGTSNISELVSKATSYSTLHREEYLLTSPTYQEQPCYQELENYPFSKKLSDLIIESNLQKQIMLQVTKALGVCKNTKEFVSSIEEIEAERILLLASLRREALRLEIQRLEYEEIEHDLSSNFGTIKILGLTVPLKHLSCLISNMIEKRKSKDYSNWYIFVITNGATVFASKPILCNDDGLVKFEESFLLTNLQPDFHINISVYSMRIRNNLRNYSHESKFHLNKNIKSLCPSAEKLFHIPKDIKILRHNNVEDSSSVINSSSFILDGKCDLRINNLREVGYFKLTETPPSSLLEGSIIIHFASQVNINEIYEDFLNIGTETISHAREGVTWNRRWCSLKAHQLFIYNYPGQEEPLSCIDLTYCASSTINPVDRTMCPRSKTLLLEIFLNDNNNRKCIHSFESLIVRYFLTADNTQTMKIWQEKLNNTISALRNWNFMKS